jgi:diguanylate cyclase (GGDEF)-like protein
MILASRCQGHFNRHQRDMLGMIAGQVAIKIDLARAHEQINRMTLTDPLTGIANRRSFQRGFDAIFERALRRQCPFSLIICDIDFFKQVNDVYGHSCGDLVLQQVARQLQTIVRTGDLAARVGGEEFAVLLEDSSAQGALEVAERLRRQIETLPLYWNGESLQVTLSLGIADYPACGGNRPELYERADQALYRAKQTGRNRSLLWQL